ncbi:MAG: transporter permease [Actinomycetia bacterium]|nr:transporter permease [Actinomycetes bacterium]
MGRLLLVYRLAARDLRRRPAEAALLLLAITAATTTLTLGLVLHGATSKPYQSTRNATAGPDVVARADPPPVGGRSADLAALKALAHAQGVTRHSGPYPVTHVTLGAHRQTAAVQVEGRDTASASVDQPKLTQGSWVRNGGVVVEAAFADAFDVHTGDTITLNHRSFRIVGVAVTAAMPPYPFTTWLSAPGGAQDHAVHPGLIWLTRADARNLAQQTASLSYVLNLKLADPAGAPEFVKEHTPTSPVGHELKPPPGLESWQEIGQQAANLVRNEQRVLLVGSWLLGLLALASIAVLVGSRMADQLRRVGLLKAVGGTPRLVASVLLAEYLVLALLGAAAGLTLGRLAAPLLTDPGAGLVGSTGAVPFTLAKIALVTVVALGVAAVATFVPAVRASRTSTLLALADSARPPRRRAWLITLSARLPVPLLLALRVAARRPRRVLLCTVSVAITVSGIIAALAAQAQLHAQHASGSSGLADPRTDRLNQVLLLITVMLIAQAAVNAIFVTWATVLDTKHSSALARALGATPQQVSAGLSAAQILPALAGAILGIPGGIKLIAAVSPSATTTPPTWWILTTVLGTVLVMAGLTAIPARISARRPIAPILQSELA